MTKNLVVFNLRTGKPEYLAEQIRYSKHYSLRAWVYHQKCCNEPQAALGVMANIIYANESAGERRT